jgi:hypothetical protein
MRPTHRSREWERGFLKRSIFFEAAFGNAAGHTEASGRVGAVLNRGIGGAAANLTQATPNYRPVYNAASKGLLFNQATNEHLYRQMTLPAAMTGGSHRFLMAADVTPTVLSSLRCVGGIGCSVAGNGFITVGFTTTGAVRVTRRSTSSATLIQLDSDPGVAVAGTRYNLVARFNGTDVTVWLNGVRVITSQNISDGLPCVADLLVMGMKLNGTTGLSMSYSGHIHSLRFLTF